MQCPLDCSESSFREKLGGLIKVTLRINRPIVQDKGQRGLTSAAVKSVAASANWLSNSTRRISTVFIGNVTSFAHGVSSWSLGGVVDGDCNLPHKSLCH